MRGRAPLSIRSMAGKFWILNRNTSFHLNFLQQKTTLSFDLRGLLLLFVFVPDKLLLDGLYSLDHSAVIFIAQLIRYFLIGEALDP